MLKSFWSESSYLKPVSRTGSGREGVDKEPPREGPAVDVTLLRIALVCVSLVIHYLCGQELVYKCYS